MAEPASIATFLFTDIEGSSRLWEREPAKMQEALAAHDRVARTSVEAHDGRVLKMTGDGMCAVFADPLDAVEATLDFQRALASSPVEGIELRARCGLHVGTAQKRDHDYFGGTLNRAARIMGAAHGGQVLLSQAVVDMVRGRLPESLSLHDLGSVRLRDLTSPERLYQLQHAALRHEFPALRSLEATPNNLPQQATSFVGRERELGEARDALRRTRLLTLVGAGGIGKTRLSLQLAAEVLDDYPDGVWLVELAAIADAGLVVQAVASVLGVKEEANRSLPDVLVASCADKRLLVVLDNCEHLLDACATLCEHLLRGTAEVRILATSREPLRIGGEVVFSVPALGVPESGANERDATYVSYPAVRLFAERAGAVLPSFHLTAANGGTIVEICRHLDGIPLAIELAAARTRAIPVETIAARLGDRFRLLSSGNRAALPRQQTLRALIDWSHDLLDERERVLFRRLAVFAGGWTLEGAESVCAGGVVETAQVMELCASLVDKSLVVANVDTGRYRLLETIRQYAGERLEASGEAGAVRTRHLDFHLAFAEAAEPHLRGLDQAEWLARLDGEVENLLAAHAWCDKAPEGGVKGLRLVNAVKGYWFSRGLLPLGRRVVKEALDRPHAQSRDCVRCIALFGAGQACSFSGEYDEAIVYLEESLAIARELGDRTRIAAALQPLSLAEVGRGRVEAARRHAEEALALARAIDDPQQIASALNTVAQACRVQGDFATAEPLYDQVVALGRRLGHAAMVAVGLLNLAMVYLERGAHGSARIALQEVLAIADETHSMPTGQGALEVASGFAALVGNDLLAMRLFGAAEATTHLTGIYRDPVDDAFLQPLIARTRDALGAGPAAAEEQAGRDAGYKAALAEVRAWLAEPARAA
jgi:predicted ATPase/class 3 adenylate cyclase